MTARSLGMACLLLTPALLMLSQVITAGWITLALWAMVGALWAMVGVCYLTSIVAFTKVASQQKN